MSWSKYTSKDAKVLQKVLLKDVFQLWKVVQQLWKFRYVTFQSCRTLATFATLQLCKVAKVAQSWSGHFPEVWCGPSKVKKNSECDNDSQKVRLRLTLKHWETWCARNEERATREMNWCVNTKTNTHTHTTLTHTSLSICAQGFEFEVSRYFIKYSDALS